MAMLVANNSSAALALGELNKNNNRLSKDLQKVSSGMKLNSAGDGAAEYAISEKMRVMVRSLGQDIENSKKGIDIVKVAEGGIQNIIDELRNMKEMAINSANDHNSDFDRAVLQKEFASRMEGINDIASTTNYNGKVLLDGTYWYKEYEEVIQIRESGSVQGGNGSTNGMRLAGGLFSGRSAAYPASRAFAGSMVRTSTDLLASSNDDNGIRIKSLSLQSNSNEAESITFDPLTGLVPNSTAVGLFPSKSSWYYPYVMYASPKVHSGYESYLDKSVGYSPIPYSKLNDLPGYDDFGRPCIIRPISFGGEGGGMTGQFNKYYVFAEKPVLDDTIIERNILRNISELEVGTEVWLQGGFCSGIRNPPSPVSVIGKFVIGEEPGTGEKVILNTNNHKDLTSYTCEKIDFSHIQGNIPDDLNNQGFTIQCEACMEYITIRFDSEREVGSGIVNISNLPRIPNASPEPEEQYTVYSYVVGIKGVANSDELETALYQGLADAKGYATGGGVQLNPWHDVRIRYIDGELYLTKGYGGGAGLTPRMIIKEGVMGTLSGGNTIATGGTPSGDDTQTGGEDTVPSVDDTTAGGSDTTPGGGDTTPGSGDTTPGGGDTASGGGDTTPGSGDTTSGGGDTLPSGNDTIPGSSDTLPSGGNGIYGRRKWVEGNPLIIHTGPKANQHLRVYINDMHTDAMGLKDVAVDPIEKALEALGKLDEALGYALNENVRMGAYQVRLQETIDNLTIQHENTTASDSTIRDADMAREMAAFVKDNILTQSAQSMLAQANQSSSSVLRLLQ